MYLSGYDVDVHNCMETILQAANRLSAVVASLASYAAGAESPRERFNLIDSVRAAMENARLLEKGIAVTLEMPESPVEIVANWLGIHQVLSQVIQNAWQAVERLKDGRIVIRLERHDQSVDVTVEDNGPGVSADGQKRMFDPFYTTKDPGKGMGMGLAISHRILDEHGGTVRYEPVASGGSRFVVNIPLVATSGA
jgi:C4-dicarboxylate-specific signal transduction histidine kinase